MSVEVRIDQGALRRLLRSRSGKARRKLEERTARVAAYVQQEAPGSMGDDVSWHIEESGSGLRGVVICTHHAVRFVLDGTKPHVIRPRRARALRFEKGGEMVFARRVNHPGTKPNNFLRRALRMGR